MDISSRRIFRFDNNPFKKLSNINCGHSICNRDTFFDVFEHTCKDADISKFCIRIVSKFVSFQRRSFCVWLSAH